MKKIYLLPNFFTLCNLLCGYWSITFAIKGCYMQAATMIYFSILFDAFDGMVARLTHTTSRFGLQFDSLSDLVSFGLAPACIIYHMFANSMSSEKLAWWACFIFVVCGALRLARYNIQVAKEEKEDFTGLPIPCAAGMIASFVLFHIKYHYQILPPVAALIVISTSLLMISTIRYSSMQIHFRKRKRLEYFVAAVILIGLMVRFPYYLLLFVFSGYTLFGFLFYIKNKVLSRDPLFKQEENL